MQMKIAGVEETLTDLIAGLAPWLTPVPTAYLVGRATVAYLRWPVWVAVIAAVIIEALGLSAVNTALALREYNASRRKVDPRAPFEVAAALAGVYLTVAVLLTVALDIAPALARYAPAVFPLLSLTGVTVLALRSDQRRRLAAIAQERADRSAARSAARSVTGQGDRSEARSVTGQGPTALTLVNAQAKASKTAAVTDLLAYLSAHPAASYREAGAAVGRSKTWAIGVIGELEQAGRVKRNGSGWEVA